MKRQASHAKGMRAYLNAKGQDSKTDVLNAMSFLDSDALV